MNKYFGHIDINPILSLAELEFLSIYFEKLKEYRISGQKYSLEQFLGMPLDSKQSYALFTAYSPAVELAANKITFSPEFTEKSNLKPCINALNYFFFQEQLLVKILDRHEFTTHHIEGVIEGKNDKGDTWHYQIKENIFYNVLDNGELFLKDRFKKDYFKSWQEIATLRLHTQTDNANKKFKI